MEKIKFSLSNPTGNFWIDNGTVVLHEFFGKREVDVKEVVEKIIDKLVVETGNIGQYYDVSTREIKEYKKKNWKYPTNLFIKATPRADKIKIKGKDYFTSPPQYSLKLSFSKRKETCDICGDVNHAINAKMWMFPFSVEPSKFSNFYSGLKLGTKLCPRCALAGLAGYLGWLWKVQGRDKLHIFIFHSDLETMHRLRQDVLKPLEIAKDTKGGNIPAEFWGSYIHETTLGILLRMFRELRARKSTIPEEGKKLLEELLGEKIEVTPFTLYAFSGVPAKAFNIDAMLEFSDFRTLYILYNRWINMLDGEDYPHRKIIDILKQFQHAENKNWNTVWRDKISWAILELRDPSIFIEDFLFEAKLREETPTPLNKGTLELFELYWKEVINMDEQLLNVLKGFGHSLGRAAQEKKEMGLLYALRNSKNPDDFFKVLNDIQYRLELTVPEDLLEIKRGEKIKGSSWLRVKTLLSIYAMNAYLWNQTAQKGED
ncbi:MAG: hypothetical protein J7K11_02270 [Candidatus Hydrothermae bacterium]|nr:hypothetical protein [Candidatus Hydrothermae bacterium]